MFVAPLIGRFFHYIYVSPTPAVSIEILGKLMLIRLAVSVMLLLREVEGTGFGFLPTAHEWKIGLRYFVWFLPVGLALSAAFGLIHWRPTSAGVMAAPVVFLGVLWVLALSEEFLARGLLQRWISDWTGSENIGLIAASILFGLSHLWFRPPFPDWKQAIVAGAMGWFCGKAYIAGQGIRAAMVTHALTVILLKTFLS
jgi:predicted Abi (CAAX) family protease